jgi:hypothetical protein
MTGCDREREVVEAVLRHQWPDSCAEDLQMHARSCAACSEVAKVSTALRWDFETALTPARLPAAGQVWWRAAVRARLESSHAAARPVTWVQSVAGACAAGAAAALAAMAWPSMWEQAARVGSVLTGLDDRTSAVAESMVSTVARSLPLASAVAALVLLTPMVVLYLALSDE